MVSTKTLEHARTIILVSTLVGFSTWEGLRIVDGLWGGRISPAGRQALVLGALAGSAVWLFFLIRLVMWHRHMVNHPELRAALNDELIQDARVKALAVGFCAVLLIQVVPLTAQIPSAVAGQLTILVGTASAISAFLYFQRG